MRTWTIPTAGVLAVIAGATAEAAPIVFTAADPSAGPGMPFPNSAAAFDAAASGARTLVTVESASAGPVHQPADSAGGDDQRHGFFRESAADPQRAQPVMRRDTPFSAGSTRRRAVPIMRNCSAGL
jgi:hypothetical protein